MDARTRVSFWITALAVAVTLGGSLAADPCHAASVRTQNFMVDAATPQLAGAVAQAAERYRSELAIHWLGRELPSWPVPCPIRVVAGNHAAQGVTTYNQAPVRDFRMEVFGTPERILDSVLPHEVTHTILATHFGRPLPRWADEGICTTVEHPSEKGKHETMLRQYLQSRRGIAMNRLFLMTEYPQDILPMYAQGYSVCRFLIEQSDARTFIRFLGDYMDNPSWTVNVRKHYGYQSLAELQENWLRWVEQGDAPAQRFAKNTSAPTQPSEPPAGAIARADLEPATPRRDPPSLQLASATGSTSADDTAGGWYHRTAAGRQDTSRGSTPLPATPPSGLRPYSAVHPQAEQGYFR